MMRIILFLATNLAVVLVASVTLNLLGVPHYLASHGSHLNLGSLLIFCAVFGFVGAFISLLMSKPMAKWSTGAQVIETPRNSDETWLVQTVETLARDARIGMPEVAVFDSYQSNAFATGWNKNSALVAVSTGLLSRFSRDEIKAVLGHEIGHVANGDMVTLTLIQGVVNTFVMFFARIIGSIVDNAMRSNNDENSGPGIGYFISSFIAEMILGILASMIVAWFSRRREFRADVAGAELGGRLSMINALRRLQAEQELPNQMPASMTAFGIASGTGRSFAHLFASHPPLEVRIQALQEAR